MVTLRYLSSTNNFHPPLVINPKAVDVMSRPALLKTFDGRGNLNMMGLLIDRITAAVKMSDDE